MRTWRPVKLVIHGDGAIHRARHERKQRSASPSRPPSDSRPPQRRRHENVRGVNKAQHLTERRQRIVQPFLSSRPSLNPSKMESTSNNDAWPAKNSQHQSHVGLSIAPDTTARGLPSSSLGRPGAQSVKASTKAIGIRCHKKSIPDPGGPLCVTGCSSEWS